MPLRIYSTESGKLETFEPQSPDKVTMYICGPTVYDLIHIGHARSYVSFDILRRWLEYLRYEVSHVQNFTDIEDSVIRKAERTGETPSAVAERYTKEFFEDAERLNLKRAHHYPTVTENIQRMAQVAQDLIDSGSAYERNGNVYFRTGEGSAFGRLSHVDPASIAVNDVESTGERENSFDFILWRKAEKGKPSWPSPWGSGRPGWHTSCYVMSTMHFGGSFDIHGGGMDLIFPHHESVMLISEAHIKKPLCDYFVHNSFVTLGKKKMSKSSGYFVTVRELAEKHGGEAIRLFVLKHHYRSLLDYDESEIRNASQELLEMNTKSEQLRGHEGGIETSTIDVSSRIEGDKSRFEDAMNNDLNTPEALSVLFELIDWSWSELGNISKKDLSEILEVLSQFGDVLGLFQKHTSR
jgi:cysteinyl-tRNA synthetase